MTGTNAEVQGLYERYPYPRPMEDLTPVLERRQVPAWNPGDSQALYFPGRAPIRRDHQARVRACAAGGRTALDS